MGWCIYIYICIYTYIIEWCKARLEERRSLSNAATAATNPRNKSRLPPHTWTLCCLQSPFPIQYHHRGVFVGCYITFWNTCSGPEQRTGTGSDADAFPAPAVTSQSRYPAQQPKKGVEISQEERTGKTLRHCTDAPHGGCCRGSNDVGRTAPCRRGCHVRRLAHLGTKASTHALNLPEIGKTKREVIMGLVFQACWLLFHATQSNKGIKSNPSRRSSSSGAYQDTEIFFFPHLPLPPSPFFPLLPSSFHALSPVLQLYVFIVIVVVVVRCFLSLFSLLSNPSEDR